MDNAMQDFLMWPHAHNLFATRSTHTHTHAHVCMAHIAINYIRNNNNYVRSHGSGNNRCLHVHSARTMRETPPRERPTTPAATAAAVAIAAEQMINSASGATISSGGVAQAVSLRIIACGCGALACTKLCPNAQMHTHVHTHAV